MTKQSSPALIEALAAGHSITAAAELSGVSAKTISRRLKDKSFQQEIHRRRAEMIERGLGRLADGVVSAANVLINLLESDKPSTQLNAAVRVLENATKLRESVELENRLRDIEEYIAREKKEDKK